MKDWNPRIIPGRRPFRRGRRWNPIPGRRHSKRWRFGVGEIALTMAAVLLLGLIGALGWPQAKQAMVPLGIGALPSDDRGRTAAVRVIDGDTFDYRGMRVRVADIDTPEVTGQCAAETALAARATRRMRALLAEGPFELHRPPNGREEDRYGRKLRIVTRGGRSLGDRLVAEGLARTWTGRREPWC